MSLRATSAINQKKRLEEMKVVCYTIATNILEDRNTVSGVVMTGKEWDAEVENIKKDLIKLSITDPAQFGDYIHDFFHSNKDKSITMFPEELQDILRKSGAITKKSTAKTTASAAVKSHLLRKASNVSLKDLGLEVHSSIKANKGDRVFDPNISKNSDTYGSAQSLNVNAFKKDEKYQHEMLLLAKQIDKKEFDATKEEIILANEIKKLSATINKDITFREKYFSKESYRNSLGTNGKFVYDASAWALRGIGNGLKGVKNRFSKEFDSEVSKPVENAPNALKTPSSDVHKVAAIYPLTKEGIQSANDEWEHKPKKIEVANDEWEIEHPKSHNIKTEATWKFPTEDSDESDNNKASEVESSEKQEAKIDKEIELLEAIKTDLDAEKESKKDGGWLEKIKTFLMSGFLGGLITGLKSFILEGIGAIVKNMIPLLGNVLRLALFNPITAGLAAIAAATYVLVKGANSEMNENTTTNFVEQADNGVNIGSDPSDIGTNPSFKGGHFITDSNGDVNPILDSDPKSPYYKKLTEDVPKNKSDVLDKMQAVIAKQHQSDNPTQVVSSPTTNVIQSGYGRGDFYDSPINSNTVLSTYQQTRISHFG